MTLFLGDFVLCTRITQLLEYIEDLTEAIDNGEDVGVIYLDFCKAFVKDPHRRLVCMLGQYGIKGDLLSWINDKE